MQKKNKNLLIYNPIDMIGFLLPVIAVIILVSLRNAYLLSDELPTMSESANTMMMWGIYGLSIMIGLKFSIMVFGGGDSKLIGNVVANDKEGKQKWYFLGAILSYFAIQMIVSGFGRLFQVSTRDVYAFYLSAGIVEEALFRGAVVMGSQFLFSFLVSVDSDKWYEPANIVSMILSGVIFALVHQRYWEDPIAMTITILGGISQAFWYIKSKNLAVPIIAHILINLAAAGSIVQSLGG